MSKTYITMYENEIRAVQLAIRDQDDAAYDPSSAYASVIDAEGSVVVEETAAMVEANVVYTLIGTAVTANAGDYQIIWRIVKTVTAPSTTYTYYHKTDLTVEEI
jgi:hypothetical protein